MVDDGQVGDFDHQITGGVLLVMIITVHTVATSHIPGSVPVGAAYFGEGNGPIVSVTCSGTELRIGDCMDSTGPIGCYHGRDAGVRCRGRKSSGM